MLLALLLLAEGALPAQARLEAAALDAIAGSCGGKKVVIDRELTRACSEFVAAAKTGLAPVSENAAMFYASLESSEPAHEVGLGLAQQVSRADRAVGDLFSKTCRFNRAGVAAALLASGEALVCALTAAHETELEHIPGRVEAGATVTVSGQLVRGLERPRLFVTRPGGEVQEVKLTSSGRSFAVKVLLAVRGEHSLEVLAEGSGGPQVVAVRRVFAGVDPPAAPPPEPKAGEGLAGVEAAIAGLRAARGLPLLTRDAELDAVAEAHSREMARLKTFAHVLPTDGSITDRLRARGYAYRSAGENIGLSEDPGAAHQAIVRSPAHLANLLNPHHKRLGLGAVRGATPDGTEGVYLTEVLAAPVGSPDPAGEVARALAAERKNRGLPPLQRDADLDGLASHQVRAAALSDRTALDPIDDVSGIREAAAELIIGSDPEEVASKNNAEARWTRLGVGAIYASSKQYGPGRLWVVLVYGR